MAAWKIAGPQIEAAARHEDRRGTARRTAFDHADSVADGSVLRVVEQGHGVFVVLSGDEPLAATPRSSDRSPTCSTGPTWPSG